MVIMFMLDYSMGNDFCFQLKFFINLNYRFIRETCSCDNLIQYDELTENKCDVVCTGNGNQYCGGHWTNSIYETGIECNIL